MENIEILKKAIKKARANGWEFPSWFNELWREESRPAKLKDMQNEYLEENAFRIIFSHDFAKAFWGEQNGSPCFSSAHNDCEGYHIEDRPKSEGYYARWVFYLERSVMQEDPVKYLKKFL